MAPPRLKTLARTRFRSSALTLALVGVAATSAACNGELSPTTEGMPPVGPVFQGGPGVGPTVGPGQPGFGPMDGQPSAGAPAGPAGPQSGLAGSINLQGSPRYFRVVGLTNSQWTHSVQDLFGLSSPPPGAEAFQDAVSGTTDFTNNELLLDVDSRAWSDYQAAAEQLSEQVTGDAGLLAKFYPGNDTDGFIATAGRRLYRRPLTSEEVARYRTLFDLGAGMSGDRSAFAKGAAVVLETMLQSPHFLYRVELGPVDAPLSGYELAAKLSLWLRDSTPDDALLDAAGRGELDTPAGVAAVAQQMLEQPAAKQVMRSFHGQLLHFDRFLELSKVGVANYDPEINPELSESAYLFFDRIFSQGLGLEEVFLSTSGFVGPRMAPFYGLAPSASAPSGGFAERELGNGRLGFFTQLPFLMLYAHNDGPDAIHRGVSMSLDVLCAPLGPPAAVIPPLPTPKPGQTNRMRVDEHTSQCGGACHNEMINPLGFAFEHFDGMGQYRMSEQNSGETLPIDASGSFNFIDGRQGWQNATELMQVLATASQTHLCYAKKLASFGLQRDVVSDDMALLSELASASASGSLKQVIVSLVQSDAFRTRAGGTP